MYNSIPTLISWLEVYQLIALRYMVTFLKVACSFCHLHIWTILQISYVSSSPILSDRDRFQSFWRTYPSDTSLTPALVAVARQYGWNQLKIITQEETLFIEVCLFSYVIMHTCIHKQTPTTIHTHQPQWPKMGEQSSKLLNSHWTWYDVHVHLHV